LRKPNVHVFAIVWCFGFMKSAVSALEAEGSSSEWATKTLKSLNSVNPTALKVTFGLVWDHVAPDTAFSLALANEFTVGQCCMRLRGKERLNWTFSCWAAGLARGGIGHAQTHGKSEAAPAVGNRVFFFALPR
jgi:hypothetical protein